MPDLSRKMTINHGTRLAAIILCLLAAMEFIIFDGYLLWAWSAGRIEAYLWIADATAFASAVLLVEFLAAHLLLLWVCKRVWHSSRQGPSIRRSPADVRGSRDSWVWPIAAAILLLDLLILWSSYNYDHAGIFGPDQADPRASSYGPAAEVFAILVWLNLHILVGFWAWQIWRRSNSN